MHAILSALGIGAAMLATVAAMHYGSQLVKDKVKRGLWDRSQAVVVTPGRNAKPVSSHP